MPWVRLDDQLPIHRKVAGLSDAAFRLHVSAICWSARNLTDGYVSDAELGDVTARVRTPARFAYECVGQEIWHFSGEKCESEKCPASVEKRTGGFVIHDYWQYQPTREQVLRDRKAAAQRQERWREKRNGGTNAVTNAVSSPSPPRPEGKRGGRAAPATARAAQNGSATRGSAPRQPPPVAEALQHALHPERN